MKKINISLLALVPLVFLAGCGDDTYDMNVTAPEVNVSLKSTDKYTVTFENNSVHAVHHLWRFGDDAISQEVSPSHTYALPGLKTVYYTAYSENYIKADLDSIKFTLKGTTAPASDFVGTFSGEIIMSGNAYPTPFETTSAQLDGNALKFGYVLKMSTDMYKEWGYTIYNSTDGFAKILFKNDGFLVIPQQLMYSIKDDSGSYAEDVYAVGQGYYNADTKSLSIEYAQQWVESGEAPPKYKEPVDFDPLFEWEEKVLIATKK